MPSIMIPRTTTTRDAGLFAAATLLFFARSAEAGVCEDGSLGEPEISYASSSKRLYVNGGCATIRDLHAERLDGNGKQKGPIWYFDEDANEISDTYTGTYYLENNIHIRNGGTLSIDGDSSLEGACLKLLIGSGPAFSGTDSFNIRAHGGNLDVRNTAIFSWDIEAGAYDEDPTDGRPYLSAITEKITGRPKDTCPDDPRQGEDGYSTGEAKVDMGIARMDILDSEIGYLGYSASESYGVSYKARGLCKDLTNVDIFDDDNGFDYAVYGDITNTKIHHNWFGHYSFGHQGGKWNYNEVHDNHGYGFDPHDDSDHLEIIGNKVYNNQWHGIIASKRCTDVKIQDNEVYDNGKNGIMLHRSCDRAIVSGNNVHDNVDSGVSLYESFDCKVYNNVLKSNLHGIRWSNGAGRSKVYKNDIINNQRYAFYMYKGNDEPQAEDNVDGHPRNNRVWKNNIRALENVNVVWRMRDADSNTFLRNKFRSGGRAKFTTSTETYAKRNRFPDGFGLDVDGTSCFDSRSQSWAEPKC